MALEQAGPARAVSSDAEPLILVDEQDNPIGTLSKGACHDGDGVLHRAFSIFLFDDQERLLVQRRAGDKRLWPLHWANSCCSHPRARERMPEATARRVNEEIGVDAELEFIYKFRYQARYLDLGSEHELCWVYAGRTTEDAVRPNPSEIADWAFLSPAQVDALVADNEAAVAPWFRLEWRELRRTCWDRIEVLLRADP